MSIRTLNKNEKLWVLAMVEYYTIRHYNKRVVQLLTHTVNVGTVDDEKPAGIFYNEYFNAYKAGNDVSGISASSDWLNTRRKSIIKKYKDEDELKKLYKKQKQYKYSRLK